MELVPSTDPILKQKCQEFDFSNPPFDPVEFARDLVKMMYDHNAIGISANQVGVPYRVFALRAYPENFVCFNPKMVMPSDQEVLLEEGCLSFPNLFVKVKRPQHCRVRFTMPNGDTRTDTFTGITARAFQHELDHLDGIVYYTRANDYHREQAFKKKKRREFSGV
jgi:peptide deformylase